MEKELLDVLVVEDDAVDFKAVERALSRYKEPSYTLHRAESMEKGKRMLEDHDYDAVILDLGLPDVQGMDSVIHFHANAPATPIVVLTGQGDSQTADGAVSMGAEDFLLKSDFYPDRLVEKLRLAMQRKQARISQMQNAAASLNAPRTEQAEADAESLRQLLEGLQASFLTVQSLDREEALGERVLFHAKDGRLLDAHALDLARAAGSLPELGLACVRATLEACDRSGRGALHLDLEPEALTPSFAAKLLAEMPDASLRKRFRFFLPANAGEAGLYALEPLKTLRNAGFGLGFREVGGGGTVMETLALLQPAWLRLSGLLCEGVSREKGRRLQLQRWLEMLEPLRSPILCDPVDAKDLPILKNLGLHAAVLPA